MYFCLYTEINGSFLDHCTRGLRFFFFHTCNNELTLDFVFSIMAVEVTVVEAVVEVVGVVAETATLLLIATQNSSASCS